MKKTKSANKAVITLFSLQYVTSLGVPMDQNVEIICVGNELLIGKTLNTNAQWLAKRITTLGLTTSRITVVRDNIDEILECSPSLTPEQKQKIKQETMEETEHLVKQYRGSK